MVDSRAKGARGETQVRDLLRIKTNLGWERTPGSGALDKKHGLKGDLYIPNSSNVFCVEVKNYAEDHLTSEILTSKAPQIVDWWEQTIRESKEVSKKPLLIFKFNRSKIFVAFTEMPHRTDYRWIFVNLPPHEFYVSLLEDWLDKENPKFT